jgi:hypothetical protein
MITETSFESWFPDYLSVDAKDAFQKAFGTFKALRSVYSCSQQGYVQGAAFKGFTILRKNRSNSCEEKQVSGIILSNSCDIDCANRRDYPVNVTFAPLLTIESLGAMWTAGGANEHQVRDRMSMVKRQSVSHLFYLPNGPHGKDVVCDFSTLGVMRMDDFIDNSTAHIFTLNDIGYYFFLIKLSIHFLRLTDGVQRESPLVQ